MKNTIESFKEAVSVTTDETEIDGICIRWLRMLAMDHGRQGEIGSKLIDCLEELLEI